MYELHVRVDEIALHGPDQSGYKLRCCRRGHLAVQRVSHLGEATGELVELTPEAFLRSHPDVALVPGVGAALFTLTSSDPAPATEPSPSERPRPAHGRRSTRRIRPVLRSRTR